MRSQSAHTTIKTTIDHNNVRYVHMAIPCNTYSMARYPKIRTIKNPQGEPNVDAKTKLLLQKSNLCTQHAFDIASHCIEKSIAFSVENPASSLLWHTRGWRAIQNAYSPVIVTTDYCQYGEPFRKRTKIYVWYLKDPGFLHELARRCPGTSSDHRHMTLSGWGLEKKNIPTSKGCSAYPERLCAKWAALVHKMVLKA